jgi:hypothetical protein
MSQEEFEELMREMHEAQFKSCTVMLVVQIIPSNLLGKFEVNAN